MFVDDSGRRRRVTRVVGTTSGVLILAYVAFVGLTFAGTPGLAEVGVPGLGSLTQPAGGEADVGSDPVVQAVPDAVTSPDAPTDGGSDGVGGPEQATTVPGADSTLPPSPATSVPGTTTTSSPVTTTTRRGNGGGAESPSPSSTVPDKGGPPTSLPSDP